MLKQPLLERYSKKWKYRYSTSFQKWSILTGTASSHRSSLQAAKLLLSSLVSSSISCSRPCCAEVSVGRTNGSAVSSVQDESQSLVSMTSISLACFYPKSAHQSLPCTYGRGPTFSVSSSLSYPSASSFLMLSKGIPTQTVKVYFSLPAIFFS